MQRYKLVILLYIVFRYNNRKNHVAVNIRLGYLSSCFFFSFLSSLSLSHFPNLINFKIDLLGCVLRSAIRYLNRVTSTSVVILDIALNIIGSMSFPDSKHGKKKRDAYIPVLLSDWPTSLQRHLYIRNTLIFGEPFFFCFI